MADIMVKKIENESYNSIAMYLDYIINITKEMGVPYFICLDGTKYFVTRVEDDKGLLYGVAYEKEGKLKSFGLSVPAQNPELVSLTDGINIFRDFSTLDEHPFVAKENMINDNTEQLTIGRDPNGDACLVYYQLDLVNNRDCEIIYSLKNHENNLAGYLNYIESKYPRSIQIGQDVKLFKVINHRQYETYRYADSQYLVPKFKLFGYEFANARKAYDIDAVLYNVRLNGFNSCAPKPMCELMAHHSPVEQNMKKLAKIYDESIMKNQ